MKTAALILATLALAVPGALANPHSELAVRGRFLSPDKTVDWDSAAGIDLQARFWQDSRIGIGLSLGFESWDAESELSEEEDEYGYFGMDIGGRADLMPIGLSVLLRPGLSDRVSLTLEGGLRYVFVESDITADVAVEDAFGAAFFSDVVDIDDAFLGVVGADLEIFLGDGVSLLMGLGYQFDLSDPSESFLGDDIGETSFTATSVNAGLSFRF